MKKEILVNVDYSETRAAIVEDGDLAEIYFERPIHQRSVGSIYKGKVENVLPGMEAAFVDVGLEKNAFLYVTDAIPASPEDEIENVHMASIKDLLKTGQEIMVQVTKEAIGSKGARVTGHITLPGRFLVLMPTVDYIGVSRRIEDEKERDRLRSLAKKIKPKNMGLIVRTVAEGKQEKDLVQDLKFLTKLWNKIQHRGRRSKAPHLLHKDMGLVYRIMRDEFNDEVTALKVDSKHEYDRIMELLDDMSPPLKRKVAYFDSTQESLYDRYGINEEVEKALKPRVWLRSGGYLVINQTEALTAIDINTGKYVGSKNLEDTVLRTNLEAAKEISRQLRLRDIGGIIIVDFIDMETHRHRQRVVQALIEALKTDKTKTNVLGITQLGLVEMTRKKVKHGLDAFLQKDCHYCEGEGRVMSEETMSNKVRREIRDTLRHTDSEAILVELHPSVAALVIGAGGTNLKDLERETKRSIFIKGSDECHIEDIRVKSIGTKEEVERQALPVAEGDVLEVEIEEPHATNVWDGIARVEGYVLDVEGAGKSVGEQLKVKITRAFRTYAKARIVKE